MTGAGLLWYFDALLAHLPRYPMLARPNIRLWLVDDEAKYAEQFHQLASQFVGITCQRVFTSIELAVAALDMLPERPDIVLVDIQFPDGMNGLEGLRPLKERLPETPIVMYTIQDSAEAIFEALRNGASGYISKRVRMEQLAASIRQGVDGALVLEPEVARKVLGFFRRQTFTAADYDLTDRQYEVLKWLCQGLSQKEIAERMDITQHTVDNHLRTTYLKLHVHSSIEAVAKAFREGLVDTSGPQPR
jgi:DNA-binding NarL/FixJ family response regulator